MTQEFIGLTRDQFNMVANYLQSRPIKELNEVKPIIDSLSTAVVINYTPDVKKEEVASPTKPPKSNGSNTRGKK